jgi:pimeloyl-ACP methyl ester carboxylesterase
MNRLPIIYIRGYAGPTSGIDAQVDDPFYGFNRGATHVRVGRGDPMFYQFEGPMLRLMIDHDYQLLVHGDQRAYLESREPNTVGANSIWVYRFYDKAATTFAVEPDRDAVERLGTAVERRLTAKGFDIEDAAQGLLELIELLRVKVKSDDKRVILVAHSMGGLVARCMIQKIALRDGKDPRELVAKFFTYGTPHGGIVFTSGLLNWFEDVVGPAGSDIFSPRKMIGYLHPRHEYGYEATEDDDWDPQSIPKDVFDTDNVFCLIGTDSKDYGISKTVVGPKSDGLVRVENAYVRGAHRAFAFKAHSGSYGEVNSEEGYQNLRRFLFGRWKVRVDLADLPRYSADHDPDGDSVIWQLEMRLMVRGLPVILSEQMTDQQNPIQLNDELKRLQDSPDHPVPLVTTFLLDLRDPLRDVPTREEEVVAKHHGILRYSLVLRVIKLRERHKFFDFSEHLEQVFDWADAAIFDVGPGASGEGLQVWAKWNSTILGALEDFDPTKKQPRQTKSRGEGLWEFDLPFRESRARTVPVLGEDAKLRVTVAGHCHVD